ncbi:hypothetical protein Gohar_015205 [Gossypium harknessii]|uniref:Reverse transcriptase zinc-binding domain-containing protein n=1 Tax=Gossypium harknessii TaxID=34285 RepID=A0A7J9G168_9ROSI|nr:hypothetical protein [Gossypium harknessii]
MEAIIAKFWWKKGHGKWGIHWCLWNNLCSLKENGGLGFRNLSQFNIALLAKQGWCLFNYPNSLLARVLKAKYYPLSDFLRAELGNLPSLTWKSIWAAKKLLIQGLSWRIGRGNNVSIWTDRWIPGIEPSKILKIPLAETDSEDLRVWKGEATGEFSKAMEFTTSIKNPTASLADILELYAYSNALDVAPAKKAASMCFDNALQV